MASKPLEVLRKGLQVLTDRAKTKEALEAQPAERKAISSSQDADEQCPDHEADLVGERRVLEALENGAPDYERGFARLDDEQKGLVKKLREAAGDGDPSLGNAVVGVGKKRKRPEYTRARTPFPDQDQDGIAVAENKLRCALDALEARGLLQSENRMSIEELVNPPGESVMEMMTDEEICQTVLARRKAREGGVVDGGDDDEEEDDDVEDDDDDGPVEPCPTYREVMQAIYTLNRYTALDGDPAARKFEAALASFADQMRSERSRALRTTHITDYFGRK